jgi:hypothetical protein
MSDTAWVSMILSGSWRVAAANGEFLDVTMQEGEPTLTTSTEARLRHLFRIRRFEDLGNNRLGVWAEPVELREGAVPVTAPQSAGGFIFPFVLVHDGCSSFRLEGLLPTHALAKAGPARAATASFAAASGGLPVGLDAFTFLNTFSGVGFPVFQGDQLLAFNSIAAQTGVDPHSPLLTLAALSLTRKPNDIPQAAWDAVVDQLKQEVDYRELCRIYFGRVESFVQNVFISNAGMVDNVGALVGLDKDDVAQFLLNQAFQAIASGVGGLSFTGAGVVGGALSVLFQQLAKDRGPSAGDFTVTLADARRRMSELFDHMITAVQNWRADVFTDWGKLKTMGAGLKAGTIAWPDSDEPMRAEAKKQLEIGLFKDLVKVRWNDMTPSDAPRFTKDVSYIPGYIEKNKNYWIYYVPYTQKDLFGKETQGYNVTPHWLGRGGTIFNHKQPDDRLPIRLFNELGVPRETVFRQWGLRPETFFVQR